MNALLYIHGNGGSAMESEHYKLLFPDCDVIGLDYQTFSPWETGQEIRIAVEELKSKYENVSLIANMMKWANVTEQELESKGIVHTDFANKHQAILTIMKNGEHWFHTEDQMLFLDNWIKDMK